MPTHRTGEIGSFNIRLAAAITPMNCAAVKD